MSLKAINLPYCSIVDLRLKDRSNVNQVKILAWSKVGNYNIDYAVIWFIFAHYTAQMTKI